VWHYHDDDLPGAPAAIDLAIAGLPAKLTQAKLTHYRVDANHSNAYTLWKAYGSPTAVTRQQYAQLEHASQLARLTDSPTNAVITNGGTNLKFTLPRQGVSLLMLDWD
jgi:xylan 1,4-beta-xylosidase